MKKSLYLFLTAIWFMVVHPSPGNAQMVERKLPENYSAEKQAEGQTRWMTRQLKLDDNLAKKVHEINLKYINRTDSTRLANTALADNRNIYLSISQSKRAELQAILTPEQYSKYLSVFENALKKPAAE